MNTRLNRTLFTLSLLVTLGAVDAERFAMGQIPAQANPGVVDTPALPNSVDAVPAPAVIPNPNPVQQTDTDANGTRVESQAPTIPSDQTLFRAGQINVEGDTLLGKTEIKKITTPYEGRDLNPEELSTLVAKINDAYRVRGYMTSLAFIPPQDLERGAITIKVLEGRVGQMEVTGNKYFRAKVISNRLSEKPGDALNIPKLEKELMQINRTEAYRLKAVLSPGERTGETKVRLEVKEQQPYQVALTFDNAGRPYIGTYRSGIELLDRNVTGHGDRFGARYMVGAGQQIASTSYTLPVGKHGTEISGLFGFSHVDVDLERHNQPNIIGNGYNYGFLLSQPLDKERIWTADLGLNARRISSFFDGDKTHADDIRSATLGLNFNKYDRYGRSFARVQSTFAPKWLGANTKFWKMESFATRVTRLPKRNLLLLSTYGQYSPSDLPPVEQFQLGGVNSVRGYTQGLLLGDRGYNATAEWRWPVPFLSHVSPWLGERIQGAFFFDYGQTWLDRHNKYFVNGLSNKKGRTSLMGAGFGVRARLTDYLQGYADIAFGLLNRQNLEPNAQPTARVHFGVRSELLSNDYKSRTDVVTPIKTDVMLRPHSVGMLRQQDLQSEVADPTLEPVD